MFRGIDILILLIVLLICSWRDIKYRKVENGLVSAGVMIRIFLYLLMEEKFIGLVYKGILSCLFTLGIITVVLLSEKLTHKELMGGGDIKILFLSSFYIGAEMSVYVLFFALWLALPVAVYLNIKKRNNRLPFVPFITMSFILFFIANHHQIL